MPTQAFDPGQIIRPLRSHLKMVMEESRGGYPPLAEGLGDVPPGTKNPEGGREQGVLLFEIATY